MVETLFLIWHVHSQDPSSAGAWVWRSFPLLRLLVDDGQLWLAGAPRGHALSRQLQSRWCAADGNPCGKRAGLAHQRPAISRATQQWPSSINLLPGAPGEACKVLASGGSRHQGVIAERQAALL